MTLVKSATSCKNCETPLESDASFCNICGAKVIVAPFTLKYLRQDFEEQFLTVDNNMLLRTLKDMVLRPEVVIQGYIEGVRKRHIKLANFIAIALTLSGLLIFIIRRFYPEALDMSFIIDESNPMAKNFDSEGFGNFMEYQGLLYIIGIPIYALFSKLTFWNYKEFTYLKHIVFIGYTQAFLSIVTFIPMVLVLVLGQNYLVLSYWLMLLMFLYSSYCYKRLFNLSIGKLLLKILLFFGVLIVATILYIIVVIAVMILNGSMQEAIEAERAKQVGYIISSAINWTS